MHKFTNTERHQWTIRELVYIRESVLSFRSSMVKPNKSILKRIKITKTGKLIRRKAGQNHFNAKESRRTQRGKRRIAGLPKSIQRKTKERI